MAVSPAWATTYYLAPAAGGGNDSNNGASASTPWLTPNHAVNCGDVILAAAGTYSEGNFRIGNYGAVTCPAGNNVAWLKCVTFDACKIVIATSGANDAMTPGKSYWGIQGWEVNANAAVYTNGCFSSYPQDPVQIKLNIFANDVCNGAGPGCFTTGQNGSAGVDYLAWIGNIAYNCAQDSAECYSGFDIVDPVNSDNLPGTHYYMAGNFAWGTVEPSICAGGPASGGAPLTLDTINGANGVQFLIDNNIAVFNGGPGISPYLNTGSPSSPIYIRHNTSYGNQTGLINNAVCPEIILNATLTTQVYLNLVQTTAATACLGAVRYYALGVQGVIDSTDTLYNNFLYSAAGNNTTGSNGTFLNNITGTNPNFVNPVEPPAPNCGSFASVPACMGKVIANFTPMTAAAVPYGYQVPSATQTNDPLFPQWLCTVTNLPPGLVTMGCLAQSSLPASPTITGVKVQ
jgi:hypothetical protein